MNLEQLCRAYKAGSLSTADVVRELERASADRTTVPLSEGAKGLWTLYKLEPEMQAYNVPLCIACEQGIDTARLRQAFLHVRQQHPLLTAFVTQEDGQPCFSYTDAAAFDIEEVEIPGATHDEVFQCLKQRCETPFRLEDAPLIRLSVLRSHGSATYVLIVAHHIVLDGASSRLLLTQLLHAYHALVQGTPLQGEPPLATFADYAAWERDWISSEQGQLDRRYWLQRLASPTPLTGMPLIKPWTPGDGHRGQVLRRELPADLVEAIRHFAAAQGLSPGVVLLAAFKTLLFRYTGQRDLIVGMPYLGRPQERFDGVIGHFINMLPIRTQLEGQDSAETYLHRLQQAVIEAIDHASYPYPQQVRDQNLHDANVSSPVFQVSYNYQNFSDPGWVQRLQQEVAASLAFTPVDEVVQAGEYELSLDVLPEDGLVLHLKYHPELYSTATISSLADHLVNLIHALLASPSERLDKLPLLGAHEHQALVDGFNQTSHAWPEGDLPFHTLFAQQVQAQPDAPAVSQGSQTLSYRQLDVASTRIAVLLRRKGVATGATVGLCVARSIDMLVGLLGIVKAGAAYVPLDPDYPPDRLSHMIDDSGCRVILAQQALTSRLPEIRTRQIDLAFFDEEMVVEDDEPAEALAATPSPAALAYVMYTSGSTGKPKGVMISHRALTNFLLSMRHTFTFGPQDRLLAVTTYSFDIAGLELYLPLISGAHCIICDSDTTKDAQRLKQLIEQVKPTLMQATPLTWSMLFRVGWHAPAGMKILCGGESMSDKLKDLFMAHRCDVWNMYGPTETTIWSTLQHLRAHQPVTVGRPIHNTRVYILDRHLNPVPIGVAGELFIGGDGVANGYHNRPELTAEKFIASPFHPHEILYRSGDLARWRPNGEVDVIGRIDHQVKVRGFRIELGEIEKTLDAHRDIESSVVLVKGDDHAARLSAYYTLRQGAAPLELRALQEHLRLSLPDYMVPGEFTCVARFPHTPNGKIDRLQLARMSSDPTPTRTTRGPVLTVEQNVRRIFMEVLNLDHVERSHGFFDLGGDSYTAIAAVEKINRLLGCEISVTSLFKHPTVETISRLIQGLLPAAPAAAPAAQQPDTPALDKPAQPALDAVAPDAIAIVGVSCQFPDAADHRAFWQNLVAGKDSVRVVPLDELRSLGISEDLLAHPDFVPQQASIDNKAGFDPAFFNISPRDAEFMDPQARLLLINAWKAVEDAGYNVDDIPDTSVFMTAGNNFYQAQWQELVSNTTQTRIMQSADEYVAWILAQGGSIPTMISNKLGLRGPSVYLSSNCSSSLTGLHLACQGLLAKEVDQALVGAASIFPALSLGYVHQPGLNFSSSGHCRAFDAQADGMVGGEGVAVVMLKRAQDALRDRDPIYAVIRGVAINNDGAEKAGFYAPSVQGQTAVIQKVLDKTGIDPATLCYVEAHGTGTALGDPIEVAALTDAWRRYTDQRQFCGLGSVKTNIGHLDTAAGMAGLIKLALGLRHGEMPRTLHYRSPNPAIDFAQSPFYVLTDNLRLDADAALPPRVALSSFGIGGTNAHAILEQCRPPQRAAAAPIPSTSPDLFVLSAQNESRLKAYAESLLAFLPDYRQQGGDWAGLIHTLQVGRKAMACRLAFPVDNFESLEQKLACYVQGGPLPEDIYTGNTRQHRDAAVAMFDDPDEVELLTRQWLGKAQWHKLGRLWVQGVDVDWRARDPGTRPAPQRVSLPGYPFAQKAYWIAHAPSDSPARRPTTAAPRALDSDVLVDIGGDLAREASSDLERIAGRDGTSRLLEAHRQRTGALDAVLCKLLLKQLIEAGLVDRAVSWADVGRGVELSVAHRRWLDRSLAILTQAGYLSNGPACLAPGMASAAEDAWHAWSQWQARFGQAPEVRGTVPLLDAMVHAIPQIITGRVPATEVMFPESSHHLVEGLYKHNPVADYFNGVAAATGLAFLRRCLERSPQSRLRILEIGAGTGSTSEHMFRQLAGLETSVAEYCYTDLSKAFLIQAERRFGGELPYLRCKVFDVEQAPGPQGFELGAYDLVIATNVLHATRHMGRTLAHAKALLRPNGLILINEIIENDLTMHLTFGLLEGWWRYEDGERRLPGGPAMSASTWRAVLEQTGFHSACFPAAGAEALGLQIMAAQSDGKPAAVPVEAVQRKPAAATISPAALARASSARGAVPASPNHDDRARLSQHVERVIVHQLAASLKLELDEIRFDESFSDYGLDSLTGVNLVKQLNLALKIELDVTSLFDFPTVDRLTQHVVATYGELLHASQAAPAAPVAAPAEAPREVPQASAGKEPIAIIGMSGRFPQTDDVETFWRHLAEGHDLVEPVTRWDLSRYGASCTAGGFLTDIAHFDPLFFNISGLEAAYMEPQQRIFLEEAWKALEDAGYAGESMDQRRCGVYVGCTNGDYLDLNSPAPYPAQAFWGNMSSIIPSRISYYLNLHGPALAVDTACSSSLVALHLACQGLWNQDTEMAIAGGVFVQCSPRLYIAGTRAGMLSPTGRCRSFDDAADGFVPAEGAGVLVLKRLRDAVADGDHIHGVIRATGINQDGTTNGITAPSAVSQQRLEQQVYDDFGLECESLQMLEAHGTGTKLGDPIEFQALTRAFRSRTDRQAFCALGSSKANIGHAQMAAGVIGVIKILLALKHRQIPPLVHYHRTNTNIALEGSPFYVNTDLRDWETPDGQPRRAAISSFGASGTNAHMVIEEAPAVPRPPHPTQPRLLALSARTASQLRQQAMQLAVYCQQHPELDLGDVSYTLLLGRRHFSHRLAVVADTPAALCACLQRWLDGQPADASALFVSVPKSGKPVARQDPSTRPDARDETPRQQLAAWARLFTAGSTVDPTALFGDRSYRRVPLPTYPFEREYHWADDKFLVNTGPAAQPGADVSSLALRPVGDSAGRAEFELALSGQEFFLRDHQVQGDPILPGAVYLEMARSAWQQSAGSAAQAGLRLRNVVLLRPIAVGGGPVSVRVALTRGAPTTFEVYSDGGDPSGQRVTHCRGDIAAAAPAPAPLDLTQLRAGAVAQAMDRFYAEFAEMGIEYGPAFRGVQAVYTRPGSVLAALRLPAVIDTTLEGYAVHPSLVDGAMQCLRCLSDADGPAPKAQLLFALQDVQVHAPCPSAMWAWVRYAAPASSSPTAPRKIDVDLADLQGRVCLSIRGAATRPVSAERAAAAATPALAAEALLPVWEAAPAPRTEPWPSNHHRIAVVGGTAAARQALLGLYPSARIIDIPPASDLEDIRHRLQGEAPLDHLIWVGPTPVTAPRPADDVIEGQSHGTLAVFRVVKALLASGYGNRPLGLTVITQAAHAAHATDPCDPTHAGISGLVGSLAKEYPNWRIRAADLPAIHADALQALRTLPPDPDGNTWLYRQRQWFSQRLLPFDAAAPRASRFRRGAVYVIAGGAGGLGMALSAHLIRRYQAQVVWLGRKPRDAAIDRHIEALSADGPPPCYLQADATDAASLRQARLEIQRRFGAVHGLIQSALVFDGASLDRMTERQFLDVLRAKVDVGTRLVEAFAQEPLELILFISSINSYLKAMGQSNYAAACTFKDSLALHLAQTLPCAVKVINLGYCFNNASADQKRSTADANKTMDFIDREELMAGIEALCGSSLPQMTLMKFSPSQNTRGIRVGREQAVAQGSALVSHLDLLRDPAFVVDTPPQDLSRIKERMQALNALAL
ncbi:non-ribosomal peptide synthetase [Caldimonas brevitalea]|uniref:Malonyl CoA-acyl carrier protein transacylase n=1 Tax=Caldimonas brevitalea TaxID=413882 RepID=A0A0G3BJ74_9BURK|nr:non-ribosomal peptide synthetase [Caldimonas brevitalea]AKJ29422.1 malonyl CoA-acyl carrier protein transacylase [Caldimonas brevitalea]